MLGRFWRIDWPLMRQLIVVGAPISGAFLLEYGVFAAAALLMGWIGTAALAAHQIALQIAAVLFMVPFGIAMAATVRVGHAAGRGDAAATRRAGFAAIALGVVFMATMTLLVALTRHTLPLLFLGSDAPDPQTVALAASLLLLGASFFIADGVQTIAAGALRGLNDTRVPLMFAAISFWLIGFVGLLGVRLHAGAWRLRHLDRPFDRHRGLCGAVGLALPASDRAAYLPEMSTLRADMIEQLTISRLGHRGDGVADTAGGPVFVPYTLPGEVVEVEPFPGHPDRRHLLRVDTPSAERIAPICPHFGVCGGCQTQHWDSARYRDWKRGLVVAALRQAGLDAPVGDLIDAHGAGRRRATFHARRSQHGRSRCRLCGAPRASHRPDRPLPGARAAARRRDPRRLGARRSARRGEASRSTSR